MSDERDPERDQVLPVPNNTVAIHDLVREDLAERLAFGTRKYGTPLQAHNGRNALLDAYEEALDLCVYLKQALVEREAEREAVEPVEPVERVGAAYVGSWCECGHQVHIHGFFSGCLADSGDWTQYCACTLNRKDFS